MKSLKKSLLTIAIASLSFSSKSQIYINVPINQPSVLVANAGTDAVISSGNSIQIGGFPAASGGTAAYTYNWTPGTELSDATIANPVASPLIPITYTLVVTDSKGCSDNSTVTLDIVTGSDENEIDIAITIYPNPNDGNFQLIIDSNNEKEIDIEIINTTGQIVYNESLNKPNKKITRQVDVSNYAKGIYTIKVKGNEMSMVRSFVVR